MADINLIFDIETLCRDFNLRKVRLFVPSDYSLFSLAGSSALATYLNEVCHIETTLVAYQEKINAVSLCLPLAEAPNTISVNANDFLAILIDCALVEDCDNDAWNRTFCALQVRGKVSMKDFGTEAYNDSDALCGAEIIYEAIRKHSNYYQTRCPNCWNYLYLAMLDATSMFKLHMKTNTFEAIQDIIMSGANVNIKPECFKKKESNEIKVLEHIYTENIIEDYVGHVVFSESDWNKISTLSIQNVLEYIRFVKLVDMWIAFVRTKKGYNVYVQGNTSGKFDCTKMLKDYKGTGSRKKAKCKISENEINDILELAKKTVAEGKLKEKPRKKYTHKTKKEE